LVASYRNPFVTAHSVASLDRLAGGRMVLGVAVGYLQSEFEALGIDYHRRGALLDESVELMRRAWSGEPVHAEGPGWAARGNVLAPLPSATPHPPIWFGGNSNAAIRRVVSVGQGWMPFPATRAMAERVRTKPMEDIGALRTAIGGLHAAADAARRSDPIEVCATPFTHPHEKDQGEVNSDALIEEAAQMQHIGVTWLSIRLGAPSRAAFLENVERFGEEIIGVDAGRE
jgi:probable F420-dependent oxidoreductase